MDTCHPLYAGWFGISIVVVQIIFFLFSLLHRQVSNSITGIGHIFFVPSFFVREKEGGVLFDCGRFSRAEKRPMRLPTGKIWDWSCTRCPEQQGELPLTTRKAQHSEYKIYIYIYIYTPTWPLNPLVFSRYIWSFDYLAPRRWHNNMRPPRERINFLPGIDGCTQADLCFLLTMTRILFVAVEKNE